MYKPKLYSAKVVDCFQSSLGLLKSAFTRTTMSKHTRNQVESKNADVGDAGTSTSQGSGSSSSSSDSDVEAFAGRRRTTLPATRRPGFQRLELHELHEVSQMQAAARRAADDVTDCGDGAGTALDPLALPEPALIDQPQERNGIEAIARQGNSYMHRRFQDVLSTSATLCRIALLVDLGSTLWIRIKYRDLVRANTRRDHANLPLFFGCDEMAWDLYTAALRNSINNPEQDPCDNFYEFVCDSWKHQHRLLCDVDAAEDAMYKRTLNGIKRASQDSGNHAQVASSSTSVEEKAAALAKSCMAHSPENTVQDLKSFMCDRHLPWPEKCRWDPLAIVLDLSANGNVHLWFQVSIRLPFRVGITEPVLKIMPSAAFRSWIACMRVITGHPTGTALWLRYQKYVRKMLRVFDVSESRFVKIVSTIEAMNRLTLETLGPPMTEPKPIIVRMATRNLTKRATFCISTGRLFLLFDEYLMWARRFSPSDIVQVENLGLLRTVVYVLGFKAEKQEALTLSLGLLVVHELGWMTHRGIADVTLELAGLPPSSHTRCCLVQIESTVGIGWLSSFSKHQESECFVRDMTDVLTDAVARRSKAFLQLHGHSTGILWMSGSIPARVLPEPSCNGRFFADCLNVMVKCLRLQEQDITNVLKPYSVLSHRWSFYGALMVAEDYFVFPFYHSDLPPAVNYGSAGRLIADEVLRGLYHQLVYNESQNRSDQGCKGYLQYSNDTLPSEWPPYHLDTEALLPAFSTYTLAVVQNSGGAYAMW
ncbi:hypothetical protein HPB49_015943 [Dermacentor silvarum]|uniref:Uncharacterized protein n=1 Tax=Dermacentor silvarum TaxID=543639 RepID=A0ACB8CG64_DERSI|nr:hypothetical protein HPB49_015943 [Dermacentor silvarum]